MIRPHFASDGRTGYIGLWAIGVVFFLIGVGETRGDELSEAARALIEKEQSIAEGLDQVDQRINEVVQAQEMIRLQRETRAREVNDLDGRLATLKSDAEGQLDRLRRRLQMRRRSGLGQTAWWRLLLNTDHPTTLVRRRGSLSAVLRSDLSLVKSSKTALETLHGVQRKRAAAVADLTASEARLGGQRRQLEEERSLKAEVLRRIRTERRLHRRVVSQRAAQRATLPLPANTASEANEFAAEKGHLPLPAKGRIMRRFGRYEDPELGTQTLSTGLLIDAPLGAPVRAVFDGRVVYSGWYKGYGNLVIVDHGAGHHTLYGHLLAISSAQGEAVKQGHIIGEVGDTGSLRGPQLFFELRVGRRPVDPGPWMRSKP